MKLRNKKTGEIRNCQLMADGFIVINSLKDLEEWEDYKEPKGYWYYDTTCGRVEKVTHNEDKEIDSSIGNCFNTREEAEKAVEKLKAWKSLKDKGFKFFNHKIIGEYGNVSYRLIYPLNNLEEKYLDMLFGGEDD